jgi:putative restriction endonuclease
MPTGNGPPSKANSCTRSRLPRRRVDPTNGLCLSRLHDAAFDRGLITFDEELRLVLSRRLRDHLTSATLSANFLPFAGARLTPPDRFHPSAAFLATHREQTFQGES